MEVPEISEVELAFGTTKALPPYDPMRNNNRFTDIANTLFFRGGRVEDHGLQLKKGLDRTAVYRALRAHLISFEPKHEHKDTGVGLMIEAWFEDVSK